MMIKYIIGDLTLAVSLTTPNEYPCNCQWSVARWLPRGGVRWGKPHEISNFNCWGFPQPAQLPHLVTKRGNRVGARGDWCGIPWPLGGLWGFTLSIILLSSFQKHTTCWVFVGLWHFVICCICVFVLLCYCQNELNQIWLQACFSVSLTSSRQNCNVTQDFIFI